MIVCLTETSTCVVAKPLVLIIPSFEKVFLFKPYFKGWGVVKEYIGNSNHLSVLEEFWSKDLVTDILTDGHGVNVDSKKYSIREFTR